MTSLRHSLKLSGGGVISIVGAGGKTALMFRLARELTASGDRVLTTTTTQIRVPMQQQSSIVLQSESVDTLLQGARVLFRHSRHITAGHRILNFQNKIKGFHPGDIDRIWQSGVFRWIIVEADGAAGRPLKAPAAHEPVIPDSTHWMMATAGLSVVGKPLSPKWVFRPQIVSELTGLRSDAAISVAAIAKLCLDKNGLLKGAPEQTRRFLFLNQADLPGSLAAGKQIAQLLTRYARKRLDGVLIGQTLYEPVVEKYYTII
jgi:probable selenium-dependent hydroxylase accessory protein YqeC